MTLSVLELERELHTLLGMVHRISPPLNQRPGLFLEQKDALGEFIVGLMRRAGCRVEASARSFAGKHRDTGLTAVRERGRAIPIERRRAPGRSSGW